MIISLIRIPLIPLIPSRVDLLRRRMFGIHSNLLGLINGSHVELSQNRGTPKSSSFDWNFPWNQPSSYSDTPKPFGYRSIPLTSHLKMGFAITNHPILRGFSIRDPPFIGRFPPRNLYKPTRWTKYTLYNLYKSPRPLQTTQIWAIRWGFSTLDKPKFRIQWKAPPSYRVPTVPSPPRAGLAGADVLQQLHHLVKGRLDVVMDIYYISPNKKYMAKWWCFWWLMMMLTKLMWNE